MSWENCVITKITVKIKSLPSIPSETMCCTDVESPHVPFWNCITWQWPSWKRKVLRSLTRHYSFVLASQRGWRDFFFLSLKWVCLCSLPFRNWLAYSGCGLGAKTNDMRWAGVGLYYPSHHFWFNDLTSSTGQKVWNKQPSPRWLLSFLAFLSLPHTNKNRLQTNSLLFMFSAIALMDVTTRESCAVSSWTIMISVLNVNSFVAQLGSGRLLVKQNRVSPSVCLLFLDSNPPSSPRTMMELC